MVNPVPDIDKPGPRCRRKTIKIIFMMVIMHTKLTQPVELLHISPLGSGSHSPLFVQVAISELAPINSIPGGQLNIAILPSTGKLLWPTILMFGTESLLVVNDGCPQ